MLHVVPAATEEVASAAVRSLGLSHVLSNEAQIDRGIRQSRTADGFQICRTVVVTGKAVHIQRIVEIERCIRVAVSNVASIAALLVSGNADAEIVQDVSFSDGPDPFPFDVLCPFPVPVSRMHHFGCAAIVTRNAGGSHILGLGEMLLELQKFRMIN
jgi:hypothetical protein